VITGHSLGAGTAAILACLLKSKYRDLKCFAFSPPGGLVRYVGLSSLVSSSITPESSSTLNCLNKHEFSFQSISFVNYSMVHDGLEELEHPTSVCQRRLCYFLGSQVVARSPYPHPHPHPLLPPPSQILHCLALVIDHILSITNPTEQSDPLTRVTRQDVTKSCLTVRYTEHYMAV